MPPIVARSLPLALVLLASSVQAQQVSPAPGLPTSEQQRAFATCSAQLRGLAATSGVAGEAFDRFLAGITPDMSVLPLLDSQPEFSTPIWDYLAPLVDDARIADGRALLIEHADTFARVAQASGVDAATVAAVWGVESDYGRVQGKRPLLVSLSTLSCFGRRQAFFRGELIATLKLLQSGDLTTDGLTGSWAGAFGQTQFMPSTYARIAVDGDGDGRRDLVHSVPDALASTANYLDRAGWQPGQPWGYEVKLPAGFDALLAGRKAKRPLREWVARGVTRIDGGAIDPSDTPAAVLLPAGVAGPAFVVFRNFDAIYSYNAAESYALAIALLADRLRGGGPLVARWPTDDPPLDRAARKELQTLLLARGHAIGTPDGLMGAVTRRAIAEEQQRLGLLPADGRAGQKILDALRAAGPPVALPPAAAPATPAPAP
ncbi:lytic murein transglycosylase [Pseudoxanthomonas sp.]|uniref:lytic murein transglycosylase n=1 Tax=Pseudoxanthomonas sp. TaxID=1871049 RepID=UPI002601C717|nr:lytic murein transglycosylase [Pseudoxanthomonas sp.]WDS34892.1 MAG: lytic murein transglycosylase [Pseudoxanthomonas sp.]